jgi:hypothetical protein
MRERPAIIADRYAVLQTLLDPLAVSSLKILEIRESAQYWQS